jgi:hypothetical protein
MTQLGSTCDADAPSSEPPASPSCHTPGGNFLAAPFVYESVLFGSPAAAGKHAWRPKNGPVPGGPGGARGTGPCFRFRPPLENTLGGRKMNQSPAAPAARGGQVHLFGPDRPDKRRKTPEKAKKPTRPRRPRRREGDRSVFSVQTAAGKHAWRPQNGPVPGGGDRRERCRHQWNPIPPVSMKEALP